eukprot:m.142638 g.142638  ORF g.142638 m.142638 type:complete len:417 (-) comp14883_c0_seq3:2537-3787(-)
MLPMCAIKMDTKIALIFITLFPNGCLASDIKKAAILFVPATVGGIILVVSLSFLLYGCFCWRKGSKASNQTMLLGDAPDLPPENDETVVDADYELTLPPHFVSKSDSSSSSSDDDGLYADVDGPSEKKKSRWGRGSKKKKNIGNFQDSSTDENPLPISPRKPSSQRPNSELIPISEAKGYINKATIVRVMAMENAAALRPEPTFVNKPESWTAVDCQDWLTHHGFKDFRETFYTNGFEGVHLVNLTVESFAGVKLHDVGRIRELVAAIAILKRDGGWMRPPDASEIAIAGSAALPDTDEIEGARIVYTMGLKNMDRKEATRLLEEDGGEVGTYLLRKKDTGMTVISVVVGLNDIKHYEIKQENGKYVSRAGAEFATAMEFVTYFKTNLDSSTGGIPVRLTHSIRHYDNSLDLGDEA